MSQQQGDVLLYQTNDNGDINVEDGIVEMRGGLETAAYLSLFGGNEQDDGRQNNPLQWWGNFDEELQERQQRSELQFLLRSIPAIPANLRRLEDAASRDLAWFVATGVATEVMVEASMPGVNKVSLKIGINAAGQPAEIEFLENWKADT